MKSNLNTKFLSLIFILLFLLYGCGERKEPQRRQIKQMTTPTPFPTMEESAGPIRFSGTTLSYYGGENRQSKYWELSAKEIVHNKESNIAQANVVEVKFYDPSNKEVLKISARGAIVDFKADSLKFQGEVEANASTGEKLTVRSLTWDNKKKLLIGKEFIRITRKGSVMTAKEMEADPQLKKVKLSGDVKVYYPDAGKFLKF